MSVTAHGGAGVRRKSSAPDDTTGAAPAKLGPAAQFGITLLLVAVATLLAFVVDHLIAAPNLTLIFVLPVIVAATFFGWGPALLAAVAGVLAFDFFFTQPYFSLRIASSSDLWAAALLLVIAAIVSTVAAESRRQAGEARRAAERASALQALAHAVIEARPSSQVVAAAANALHLIFKAPAVVFAERSDSLSPDAVAGGPELTQAVSDAANGAMANQVHTRGETYPYDQSPFDFWPVATPGGVRLLLGVDFSRAEEDRPRSPEQLVDVVAGYLAAAFPSRA
jgi:K+-sensing histidine kinase KdpD